MHVLCCCCVAPASPCTFQSCSRLAAWAAIHSCLIKGLELKLLPGPWVRRCVANPEGKASGWLLGFCVWLVWKWDSCYHCWQNLPSKLQFLFYPMGFLRGRNICLEKHCKAMVNSYNTTLEPGWPITKGFISSQLDCIVVKWHIVLPRL